MVWVGIFYLSCLAFFLEFASRAKELPATSAAEFLPSRGGDGHSLEAGALSE
jgi:hypothetical protein